MPGDLVVVCSDGVTEARNQAGDEFGRDRFVEALNGRHGSKPEIALEHVLSAVKNFSQGAAQADDITAARPALQRRPVSRRTNAD